MIKYLMSLFKSGSNPIVESEKRAKELDYWKNFWPTLQDATLNSEEHVDKKIFALSAGAIGLEVTLFSLPFMNNVEKKGFAICAAACFLLTLCGNLYIQIWGWKKQAELTADIRAFIQGKPWAPRSKDIYDKIAKNGERIRKGNSYTSIILIIGIASLSIFTFLNI